MQKQKSLLLVLSAKSKYPCKIKTCPLILFGQGREQLNLLANVNMNFGVILSILWTLSSSWPLSIYSMSLATWERNKTLFSTIFELNIEGKPKILSWSERNLVLSKITTWMTAQEKQRRECFSNCWLRDPCPFQQVPRASWFTIQHIKETIKQNANQKIHRGSRLLSNITSRCDRLYYSSHLFFCC